MLVSVFRPVFRHVRYRVVVLVVAVAVILTALLLPNRIALWEVMSSGQLDLVFKLTFIWNLLRIFETNFNLLTGSYLVIVAILFGINVALLTFYIRRRQEITGNMRIKLAGLGGTIASVLGIGCAACGSVVLTSLLGMFGASGLLLWLPLHGFEFGILGLLLLGFSVFYLTKRINDPLVCPVKL